MAHTRPMASIDTMTFAGPNEFNRKLCNPSVGDLLRPPKNEPGARPNTQ